VPSKELCRSQRLQSVSKHGPDRVRRYTILRLEAMLDSWDQNASLSEIPLHSTAQVSDKHSDEICMRYHARKGEGRKGNY
jgi:hypothetical protein